MLKFVVGEKKKMIKEYKRRKQKKGEILKKAVLRLLEKGEKQKCCDGGN